MKRIVSILISALFIGAGFGIAMAQEGTAPSNAPAAAPAAATPATAEHADELAAFHRLIAMHHRMLKRLKQNPALASDDSFVGKYPDLRDFFNKYQGSKERFLANPGTYLKMSEKKAVHREQTRSPGAE